MSHSNRLLSVAPAAFDPAPVNEATSSVFCFSLDVTPDPGVIARVLEQFAKRGLVPTRWHSDVIEPEAMQIDIQIVGLPATRGQDIARCLRAIVGVNGVLTADKGPPGVRRLDMVKFD